MSKIFISYRHQASMGHVGHLYGDLSKHFGPQQLVRDIDTFRSGTIVNKAIKDAVDASAVLLVVIGRQWLTSTDDQGQPRLDDPEDYVRKEVSAALKRNILVIPVLVQGANMPGPQELPCDLVELASLIACEISDARWEYDVGRLIERLKQAGAGRGRFEKWTQWAGFMGIALTLFAAGLWYLLPPNILSPASPAARSQVDARRIADDLTTQIWKRFNSLYETWKEAPDAEAGKKVLAEAKAILLQLRPSLNVDGASVFLILSGEIEKRTIPKDLSRNDVRRLMTSDQFMDMLTAFDLQPPTEIKQIEGVRDTFNKLFNVWNAAPGSEKGKKALADARAILEKLRPNGQLDGGRAVFDALDKEIQQGEPGSEQLTKLQRAFSAH